ncbi:MAG TPA: phage portal protein [Pedomonas sp.]|uniref:phage portal protein n=1 Tax=Pedomonas sp. TaxID=2976421 RepID=UPI002F42BC85
MNLLKKALGYVVRRLTLTEPEGWNTRPSHAGETVTPDSALSLSTVWACTNLLAGTIASLPLKFYSGPATQGGAAVTDHPVYKVLAESPNADQTPMDFWEFLVVSLELWGNAYARKVMSGNRLIALVPVAPDAVAVSRRSDGKLLYRFSDEGRYYELTEEGVFHIRGFGGGPLGGMSTLSFARHSFGLAQAIEKAAGGTFANGLRPSGLLKFAQFLTKEQREVAEQRMVEKFVGAVNAGRPMVLEGGTEWQQLTINPEDAQMLQSRAFSVEDICRFFGVPPFMVGHTEKSTSLGTGLEQQLQGFQKFTLRRRLKRIEQAISKQLLSPADRSKLKPKFNVEGLLRADSKARSDFYAAMIRNGIMTVNEVRALENLAPIEGGDVARTQSQNIPLGHNGGPPLEDGQ